MNKAVKFRFALVGNGSLLKVCGDTLAAQGHDIVLVISSDCDIAKWATGRDLPLVSSPSEALLLPDFGVDYLLSIVNTQKLPLALLSKAAILSINYHDGPLPRYAGSHATSWALLNREDQYAIAWHVMTQEIDAGDIVKQIPVQICSNDTALTINGKCFEAAIEGFVELLGEIESQTVIQHPQDRKLRTFFPLNRRPCVACTVVFEHSSERIHTLVRALDFGPYWNPMGSPKILLRSMFAIVTSLEVRPSRSRVPPGTIVEITSQRLIVSTADWDVVLEGLRTIDGIPISLTDLVEYQHLGIGSILPSVEEREATRISMVYEDLAQHETFWRERLLSAHPMPFPYATTSSSSQPGDVQVYAVDHDIGVHVVRLATLLDRPCGDVLLAALVAFLARISSSEKVAIGYSHDALLTGVSNLEAIVANCVPLCIGVDKSNSLRDLVYTVLGEVGRARNEKSYIRDLPFRDPTLRSRLHLVNPGGWPMSVEQFEDMDIPFTRHATGWTFTIRLSSCGTACAFYYDSAAVDPLIAQRLAEQLRFFLEQASDYLDHPYYAAPILPPEQRRRLLVDLNDTASDFPSAYCLHDLIEEQVMRTPNAAAVKFGSEVLTYVKLNSQANRLAHYLLSLPTRPGDRVAIALQRGTHMIVALLATLKASAAFVPIEPSYPEERLVKMLEDCAPTATIVDQALLRRYPQVASALASCGTRVIDTGALSTAVTQEPVTNPSLGTAAAKPYHPAYVIYTSGSTGQPKGALNSHVAIVNRLHWMQKTYSLDESDTVLQKTPFSFDVAVWEFFWPLLVGARLVVAQPDGHKDPAYLADLIQTEAVTIIHFVPSMLQAFLTHTDQVRETSLRHVICSGEVLQAHLVETFHRHFPSTELHNLYGPTEAAIDVTAWTCVASVHEKNVPIGRPMANTQIYLTDAHGQLVPEGAIGEICIGGVQVGMGYLNRPALTITKFVPDPYSAERGARMYRTGDLGRWRMDGAIEFLGRTDFQVKLRGYRIEPGEIEACLLDYPGIREAAVLARSDGPGGARLVAYCAPQQDSKQAILDLKQVRAYLQSKLPEHMVPAAIVTLDSLPVSANGKSDVASFPRPAAENFIARDYDAPRGGVETMIAFIWADLLQLDRVGRYDDFFELGGDSLLTLEVVHELAEKGVATGVSSIFLNPTVERLAAAIARSALGLDNRAVPVRSHGDQPPLFLVHDGTCQLIYAHMLARWVDTDIPIFGLPPVPLAEPQPDTIEVMAHRLMRFITVLRRAGPCRIAGWSTGGLIAYEIAATLLEAGESVDFIGLLDTNYPMQSRSLPVTDEREDLLAEIRFGASRIPSKQFALGKVMSIAPTLTFSELLRLCQDVSLLPTYLTRLDEIDVRRTLVRWRSMAKAERAYRGRRVSKQVHLFRADSAESEQPFRGWDSLLPQRNIIVVPVEGTHQSMMSDSNIRAVGERLSDAINSLQPDN